MKMSSKVFRASGIVNAEASSVPVLLGLKSNHGQTKDDLMLLRKKRSRMYLYLELAKPEVTFLVLVATALGFVMGSPSFSTLGLIHVLLGVFLLSAGTAALNHCLERVEDSKMRRTAQRPLPAGLLSPIEGQSLGVLFVLAGVTYLMLKVNLLCSFFGFASCIVYLLIYTPLKTRSSWCTFIGAFPGAAPVLIGWTASTASISIEAVLLYSFLFLWQFPHFLAIAWMYQEDYARAGMRMLPINDADGKVIFRQVLIYSFALVLVSLVPYWFKMTGSLYLFVSLILGTTFLYFAYKAYSQRTKEQARILLHVTVVYLPVLYAVMVFDRNAV